MNPLADEIDRLLAGWVAVTFGIVAIGISFLLRPSPHLAEAYRPA